MGFFRAALFSCSLGFIVEKHEEKNCKVKYELFDYNLSPNVDSVIVASDGEFRVQALNFKEKVKK